MLSSILFLILFAAAVTLFTVNVRKIIRNIRLGRPWKAGGSAAERWKTMALIALGQKKMFNRPVAAVFHFLIYAGFIIVNVEVLEIIIDGLLGTHRSFGNVVPVPVYNFLIGSFEFLAAGVLLACVVFLFRRNVLRLKRFASKELNGFPRSDANLILITEILLMTAFLTMNACDSLMQDRSYAHYIHAGSFPLSSFLRPLLAGRSNASLELLERGCWWFHITGILAFLNYLPYSKHFHILLAFPNTYWSNLKPQGYFNSNATVTSEVKLMLDPSLTPDAAASPEKFGAKDITDLTWKQLMDAYSCTECGRCTSSCPANQTGKLLSPRKIMMDTRDRATEVGKNIDRHGKDFVDNKALLGDYITAEELWACTSCNACVTECPVNINPLSIIMDLRRYLVMEESKPPAELAMMMSNIENNGAPWQFSPADRFNWAEGLEIPTMADMQARGETPEVLFWVGCAGSFDERYKSVTRSFARILIRSEVKFAVLGLEESCNGDPAKRAGNEFLAQMQGMQNITTLNNYGVKKIVTACPHCFNTIKNEYPDLGGHYEVMHHTAFLNGLLKEGKVVVQEDNPLKNTVITYHDSCYLGRANGVYEAPREILESFKAELKEMKKCRSNGLCCGAGGAQMFKEEEKGTTRISTERAGQAAETGAGIVASACPFCMTMMSDGIKSQGKEETMVVKDVAELLDQALNA